MLTLHSLVGVDADVLSLSLFTRFLTYYRGIGVDRFVLDLHSRNRDGARIDAFTQVADKHGAELRRIYFGPYTAHQMHRESIDTFIRDYCGRDRWCLLADSDEFISFPGDAPEFLRRCEAQGRNLVVGNLVDRLGFDPPFAEIADGVSLDSLFPWSYPLTRHVRAGVDRKVCAVRSRRFRCADGRHQVVQEWHGLGEWERDFRSRVDRSTDDRLRARLHGWYPVVEPPTPRVRRWRGRLAVHHFAWDSLLQQKMLVREQMPGLTHPVEVRNVMKFAKLRDPRVMLRPDLLQPAKLGV